MKSEAAKFLLVLGIVFCALLVRAADLVVGTGETLEVSADAAYDTITVNGELTVSGATLTSAGQLTLDGGTLNLAEGANVSALNIWSGAAFPDYWCRFR